MFIFFHSISTDTDIGAVVKGVMLLACWGLHTSRGKFGLCPRRDIPSSEAANLPDKKDSATFWWEDKKDLTAKDPTNALISHFWSWLCTNSNNWFPVQGQQEDKNWICWLSTDKAKPGSVSWLELDNSIGRCVCAGVPVYLLQPCGDWAFGNKLLWFFFFGKQRVK